MSWNFQPPHKSEKVSRAFLFASETDGFGSWNWVDPCRPTIKLDKCHLAKQTTFRNQAENDFGGLSVAEVLFWRWYHIKIGPRHQIKHNMCVHETLHEPTPPVECQAAAFRRPVAPFSTGFLETFFHQAKKQMKWYEKQPASSKWPFDHPNGGHLTPERVT